MVIREALRLGAAGTGLGLWAATFLVAFLSPSAVGTFSLPLYVGVAVRCSSAAAAPGRAPEREAGGLG